MGLTFQQKRGFFVFLAGILISFTAACVSAGSSKLFEVNVGKIVDGKTTKDEIAEILGEPEQILKLDRESLENYLSRVAIKDSPAPGLPEDQYEVWIYQRWSHVTGLVLSPSYEEAKVCIIVINSKDICVKRMYAKESSFEF